LSGAFSRASSWLGAKPLVAFTPGLDRCPEKVTRQEQI
jgi:hypothetical protein